MNFQIRKLRSSDAPIIAYLEEKLLNESIGEVMLKSELHNKYAHFWVAEIIDETESFKQIGYIGAWIIDGGCDIINFLVDTPYQHQGIGQALYRKLEQSALIDDATEITLEVKEQNIQAQTFYLKQGFEKISIRKNYYHDGSDAYLMRKEL